MERTMRQTGSIASNSLLEVLVQSHEMIVDSIPGLRLPHRLCISTYERAGDCAWVFETYRGSHAVEQCLSCLLAGTHRVHIAVCSHAAKHGRESRTTSGHVFH